MHHLAIATPIRDECRWLTEWLRYHFNRGVDHVLLFNNDDDPAAIAPILEPFLPRVTVINTPQRHPQMDCLSRAIEWGKQNARWLALIDADEFILPRATDSIPALLQAYASAPALAMNWKVFGSSGFVYPPSSAINHFLRCANQTFGPNHLVKLIIQPSLVSRLASPHCCEFSAGSAVDGGGLPVLGNTSTRVHWGAVQLNHYIVRSFDDFLAKLRRGSVVGGGRRDARFWLQHDRNECFDDEISRRFGHEGVTR